MRTARITAKISWNLDTQRIGIKSEIPQAPRIAAFFFVESPSAPAEKRKITAKDGTSTQETVK